MSELNSELIEKYATYVSKKVASRLINDYITVQNCLYAQLESLSWLQRRLAINGELPPLRGWAASPDVLLRLHTHIITKKPKVIVEFGSGSSTLVIADALRQNGMGRLFSFDHNQYYGNQTLATLKNEKLDKWVDLRVSDLEPWTKHHLNPVDAEKPSLWYATSSLHGINNIDLIWVDGPPGVTCLFSRYPALPALSNKLSSNVEVWMDDTNRQEEIDICQSWSEVYNFEVEFIALEKGLGRLTRKKPPISNALQSTIQSMSESLDHSFSEKSVGLDFSLPEER